MKIGELTVQTGVKAELIRYYERIGLIERPARSAGNYRSYSAAHVESLLLIKECRDVGFDIDDIRAILDLSRSPARGRPGGTTELHAKLQAKAKALANIERRIGVKHERKPPDDNPR